MGATVPVKGKVTYKGKPLTEGEIVFEPDNSGREAHGSIQPDGSFELTTFKTGDGAVPGTHRVAVTSGNQQASRSRQVPEHQLLEDRGRGRRGEDRIHRRLQVTSGEIVDRTYSSERTSLMMGSRRLVARLILGSAAAFVSLSPAPGGRHCRRAGHVPRAVLRGTETGRDGIPTGQRARSLGGRAHRRWASPAGGS